MLLLLGAAGWRVGKLSLLLLLHSLLLLRLLRLFLLLRVPCWHCPLHHACAAPSLQILHLCVRLQISPLLTVLFKAAATRSGSSSRGAKSPQHNRKISIDH